MKRCKIYTADSRSGVTLVEMLTVVAIMMFLLSIAAPLFKTNNDKRMSMDTARAMQGYLQDARARAMTSGRPCGVAFIPFENYPTACIKAQLVETPPLYTGDTYTSTVTVKKNAKQTNLSLAFKGASERWLQPGNLIRFGGRGVWYILTAANACDLQNGEEGPDADYRPWSSGDWTTSFEIQQAPISQASNYLEAVGLTAPVLTPRGAAIDLRFSGMGANEQINNASQVPVLIMFSSTGEVNRFTHVNRPDVTPPTEKIYMLVGQWHRSLGADFTPEDNKWNYQNYDNCWIVIDPATGMVDVQPVFSDGDNVSASRVKPQ